MWELVSDDKLIYALMRGSMGRPGFSMEPKEAGKVPNFLDHNGAVARNTGVIHIKFDAGEVVATPHEEPGSHALGIYYYWRPAE